MGELGERKREILRAVIVEYVTEAEPVASDTIVRKYELGVKSATVRSELANMAELGYLEQPHTSAGRVPSDLGYRYYVDHLVLMRRIGEPAKRTIETAAGESDTLRELLRESTKALSRLTHLASAAATVRDGAIHVRSALVTALGPGRALLIVALENGHVENRVLELPPGAGLEDLGEANELLQKATEGKTVRQVSRLTGKSAARPKADLILQKALGSLKAISKNLMQGQVIVEGEEYLLAQPEFISGVVEAEEALKSLEDEAALLSAVSESHPERAVTIGKENESESLRPFAILRRTFTIGGEEAGSIALIGPTRMDYDRGLSLLDFTSKAISETLTKTFRGE